MPILIDSASTTGYGDTNCDSTQLVGQCFQVQNTAVLDYLSIAMKKNGTISGNLTFTIYAISGTYGSTAIPTGSVLATSDSFAVSGLTTSYVTKTIYFTGVNAITMTVGERYFITCTYTNTAWPNAVLMQNKTPSFHGGNQAYKASGVWNALATYDMAFDLQGIASGGGVAQVHSNMLLMGV